MNKRTDRERDLGSERHIVGRFASESDAMIVEHLINDLLEMANEDGDEIVLSHEVRTFLPELPQFSPNSPHVPAALHCHDLQREGRSLSLVSDEDFASFFEAVMRWKGATVEQFAAADLVTCV